MFIETESTPNPATLKFIPGRDVMGARGTADFASPEAAEIWVSRGGFRPLCASAPSCASPTWASPRPRR